MPAAGFVAISGNTLRSVARFCCCYFHGNEENPYAKTWILDKIWPTLTFWAENLG